MRTIASGGYQLRVQNPARLAAPLLQGLVDCWRHSYRAMATRFNPGAPTLVTLQVVEHLGHPGETFGANIRINADWIRNHPNDLDVMTHEQFHVAQDYGPEAEPGWAIEGLADYARWKFGLSNRDWSLPPLRPQHRWTDSYRVTAAFFSWLEENRRRTFPEELDASLRQRSYNPHFWQTHFEKSVEHLWAEYTLETAPVSDKTTRITIQPPRSAF